MAHALYVMLQEGVSLLVILCYHREAVLDCFAAMQNAFKLSVAANRDLSTLRHVRHTKDTRQSVLVDNHTQLSNLTHVQ